MTENRKGELFSGFTYGNAITLATMLVCVVGAWVRLENALADHDRRILELETADKSLTYERMQEGKDVANIKADLRWIRNTLERLERELKARD